MLDISLNDGDEGKPAAAGAPATSSEEKRQRRVPRRVIHCSDGVVEEYSTDEEELEELRFESTLLGWISRQKRNQRMLTKSKIGVRKNTKGRKPLSSIREHSPGYLGCSTTHGASAHHSLGIFHISSYENNLNIYTLSATATFSERN